MSNARWVGYWLTDKAQQEYWGKREGRIRTSKFGEGWTMTDADELVKLVAQGDIALVEATYVCERNKTFDEACTYRKTTFALEERDKLDVVIDVFRGAWRGSAALSPNLPFPATCGLPFTNQCKARAA